MRYGAMFISLVCCFSDCLNCPAQQENTFIFRHIDQSSGLLHNNILSLAQDERGFIWILTPNGMQRYDGSSFVNYPYDINDPAAIPFITESHLLSDRKHHELWRVSHLIEKFSLEKNRFFPCDPNQLIRNPDYSFELYKDSLDQSWFCGDLGVFSLDHANGKTSPVFVPGTCPVPGKSGPYFIDAVHQLSWMIGKDFRLCLFDHRTKKMYTHGFNPLHHPLLEQMTISGLSEVLVDHRNFVWISSSGEQFYQYDPFNQKLQTYSLNDISRKLEKNRVADAALLVNCFFEDSHHTLWIGTRNAGLLKYNEEKNDFIPVTGEKEEGLRIHYNYNIGSIFQDREENIWLGSDKGISIFNPYRANFLSVYHDENDPRSLPRNEIQDCIETMNGDILVSTWGGGITVYDHTLHFKRNIQFPAIPRELNLTWCFIQHDDGTIWVGCQHGYIHIYDPVKGAIHTIHPPELKNFTIRCMAKDKKGNIYFGLYNGTIAKWDRLQNRFFSYTDSANNGVRSFSQVFSLLIDGQQRCWAGCEFGLKEFDPVKMTYTHVYMPDKNDPHAISGNNVQCIEQMNDSTLVIGTVYGGLNFFNTRSGQFSHLTGNDGLPSNTVNNIKKDKDGDLWFTTDYGLYKYLPSVKQFIHYNIEPGIVNSTFKRGNFYSTKDGRWLVSTETELISFHPGDLRKQESESYPVYITGLRLYDKDYSIDSLLFNHLPVKLSYKQNFLSIGYGALRFSGLEEPKYYYRLKGIDKDWVNAGTKRVANYTNLDPGDYVFEVRAGDENANNNITSFQVMIVPPFWKTSWFRILLIILAVTFIYYLFMRRLQSVRHEAQMKQKIAETEMMALRAQMNPHFIFNCINSIDALIQSNDKYHATVYLNKFAKLIRNILDSSKQNLVPLSKDVETLQLYVDLELFRNENKFKAEIHADPGLLQGDYQVPPLIIQPYVENAILHGLRHRKDKNGLLTVNIRKQNGTLNYEIIDNGVGRPPVRARADNEGLVKKTNGYGMQISSDRVRLFNQEAKASVQVTDLKDHDLPAGTKVTVHLKIQ